LRFVIEGVMRGGGAEMFLRERLLRGKAEGIGESNFTGNTRDHGG